MNQSETNRQKSFNLLLMPNFRHRQKNRKLSPAIFISACLIGASAAISCQKMVMPLNDDQFDAKRTGASISTATGDEFTIAVIGDTQNYVDFANGTGDCQALSPFQEKIQWIVDNKTTENIKYVISVGDITDDYNPSPATSESTNQWIRARNTYDGLRNANIPFGVVPGNHDMTYQTSTLHNYPVNPGYHTYFNRTQFTAPTWSSASFNIWDYPSTTNENHIDIVNTPAGDLLILYLRWHHERSAAVTAYNAAYAEVSKSQYADKKIIIVSHYVINPSDKINGKPSWGLLGHDNYYQAGEVYDKFKALPNFFMMIGGHVGGEGKRYDIYNGKMVQSFNSDYSSCGQSADGLLRIMKFSQSNDRIEFKTFKPSTSTVTAEFTRPWYRGFTTSRTADFDNNGKSQPGFFNGTWTITGLANDTYGYSTDYPVPGDYDGDGETEIAVYRPSTSSSTEGGWYVKGSATAPVDIHGTAVGDIPTPGDFDGNGTTDFAIYRPSNNTFYVRQEYLSSNVSSVCGSSGDIPVPADYNSDGKVDFASFNPSTAIWTIPGISTSQYGVSGDIPVPGDYHGEGRNTRAVYRPSNNGWYVYGSATNPVIIGQAGDIPVPGDYNGDGKTDIAVYRPSTGSIIINGQSTIDTGVINGKPVNLPYHIRKFFFP